MPVTLRTDVDNDDAQWMLDRHGEIYAAEHGFDNAFRDYVRDALGFAWVGAEPHDAFWIAERDGARVGCVAIVAAAPGVAQLRWYLVEPAERGKGVGGSLLGAALAFARKRAYESVILWTVSTLTAAARRYDAAGFQLVETRPGRPWGVDVIEQKYELALR